MISGRGLLIVWGVSKLKGSWAKESAGRFLTFFNTGLEGAHAKFRLELDKARDPNSPGGVQITQGELDDIRKHMWTYLKQEYGNTKSIGKVVSIFAGAKNTSPVAFINAKIDAGVAELERRNTNPSTPAQ